MSDDPDAGTATLRSRLAVLGAAVGDMGAWAIGATGRSVRVAAAHVRGVRRMPILPAAVLGIALAACAQAGGTQQPVATALPPSVAPTAAPTAEPSAPNPLNPAPAEMISRWTTELANGDVATMDITATKLAISGVDFPTSMRLEVFGQELVLSHSSLCAGDGRYRWSIEGDTLRFESIGPDPCQIRQKSFDGVTYTRAPG